MPAPIKLTIKFKATNLDEFVERYGVYVSQGGIFVRTKKPLAVGTVLDFEFKFQDGSSVLKGLGTVVWTREHDPARKNAPPGMGLRYDSLDDGSKERLGKILVMKGEATTDAVEEKSPEAVTSPGIQEEKTRVANADVLKKLRGVSDDDASSGDGEASPASDLFDEPLENLKPDLDELTGAKKEQEKPSPTPEKNEEVSKKKGEPFVLEEKGGDSPVETDWQDEPTPIPSQIHPLIEADEETITRDSVPPAEESGPVASPKEEPELSVADEAKEELLATIRRAKRKENERAEALATTADDSAPPKPGPVPAALTSDKDDDILGSGSISAPSKDEAHALIDNALAGKARPAKKEGEEEKEIEIGEEKSGGGGAIGLVVFLVIVVIGALAFGYWYRFMRPQKSGTPNVTVVKKGSDMKPPMVSAPVMNMKPEVAMGMEPDTAMDMKPEVAMGMEPDTAMGMEPAMVAPPVAPAPATCKDGFISVPVTSVPSGGDILVNGVVKGKTPGSVCLRLKRGYTVRVHYGEYLPGIEYVNKVAEGTKVHKQLKPLPRIMIIQTKPKGAVVFIDEKRMGRSTIAAKFDAPQEIWKLRIEKKGFETIKKSITLTDPKWTKKGLSYRYDFYIRLKSL